jgi:hypothetical protein
MSSSVGRLDLAMSTAISIKVVHEQSGKVEYEREGLLGRQQINAFSKRFPAALRARIRLFRFARGTTLIEIAVQGVPKKSDTIEIISLFLSRS